jgi:hypothetical protein
MRLWIDDDEEHRKPPKGWIWAKTLAEALEIVKTGKVTHISFDHDLGGDDKSMPVAWFIEDAAFHGTMKPPEWRIHSANPVGRANLEATMKSAMRYWRAREEGKF